MSTPVLLKIRDLHVCFDGAHGEVRAVRGISYDIHEREVVGIVGESKQRQERERICRDGPSSRYGRVTRARWSFAARTCSTIKERADALRGKHIGMIFQNPMECLDPMISVAARCAKRP